MNTCCIIKALFLKEPCPSLPSHGLVSEECFESGNWAKDYDLHCNSCSQSSGPLLFTFLHYRSQEMHSGAARLHYPSEHHSLLVIHRILKVTGIISAGYLPLPQFCLGCLWLSAETLPLFFWNPVFPMEIILFSWMTGFLPSIQPAEDKYHWLPNNIGDSSLL